MKKVLKYLVGVEYEREVQVEGFKLQYRSFKYLDT